MAFGMEVGTHRSTLDRARLARAALVTVIFLVLGVVALCSWTPGAAARGQARCVADGHSARPYDSWPTAAEEMVPPGARAIRLCRYAGQNDPKPLALARAVRVGAPRAVRALVWQFDAVPLPRPGTPPETLVCPLDDGSEILAYFAYAHRAIVAVRVGLAGCSEVTNGHVVGYGYRELTLIRKLARLTGYRGIMLPGQPGTR